MSNKNHGFEFQLTVKEIDSVRPREAGTSKINGEDISWGNALKIKTRNITLIDDKDFGVKEQETTLEIEIPCDSKSELIALNKFVLGLKTDNRAFPLPCSLPAGSGSERSTKATISASEFMKTNSK